MLMRSSDVFGDAGGGRASQVNVAPTSGVSSYSRHALASGGATGHATGHTNAGGAGQDLFPDDPETDHTMTPPAISTGSSGADRQAMLERQKQLAQQKAKQRAMSGVMLTSAAPVASSTAPLGRTISRGAPSFSAPRTGPSGALSDTVMLSSPSSRAVTLSGVGGTTAAITTTTSSTLADAIRERDRMRALQRGGLKSDTASSLEKDLKSRGIAGTYDPSSVDQSSDRYSRKDEPEGKGDIMPVAPLNVGTPVGGGLRTNSTVLDLTDLRKFLVTPVPRTAGVVQCYIERDRSGISNRLHPVYSLHLREGDRFLLASRKRSSNKTSNYLITMDKRDLNRDSASFLGKLRSNFVGTEFVIYDDGIAPDHKGPVEGSSQLRQELGIVNYASNVLGSRGPRKMKVAVPKVTPDGRRVVFQPDKDEDTMMAKFKAGYIQDMVLMINKPPKWNDQVGAYVLNFSGRVTMASVKNFQLVSPEDHDTVLLQFGRVGKDTFTMDFQWPLCPLQAFATCMSSFDYKLACE